MKSSWRKVKLDEILDLLYGKGLPDRVRINGEYPVYGSGGIVGYHNEYLVKGPGIIVGRKGSIGSIFYEKNNFYPIDTVYYVQPKSNKYDLRYQYYLLQSMNLKELNSDAAVPGLNRDIAFSQKAIIPDFSTQSRIASILSAYDDLIENNNRRIKILEQMAQAIYREWFVNFRFPGHEKGKMVDSKLGKIPEGWEVKTIGGLLKYHIGGGWGKEMLDNVHTRWAYVIRGTDIPKVRTSSIDNVPFRAHKESNLRTRLLEEGDIVFEVSGGSKDQPVGRALLVNRKLFNQLKDKVICASFCKLLRPNEELIMPELLYMHLQRIYINRNILQYQVQSTGIANFKYEQFLAKELVVVPPIKIQVKLSEQIRMSYEGIQQLGVINANLRKTRDLLLPKLVGGEVEI